MKEHVLLWPFLENALHMEGLSGKEPFLRTLWLRRDLQEQQGKRKCRAAGGPVLKCGHVGTGARGWVLSCESGLYSGSTWRD